MVEVNRRLTKGQYLEWVVDKLVEAKSDAYISGKYYSRKEGTIPMSACRHGAVINITIKLSSKLLIKYGMR